MLKGSGFSAHIQQGSRGVFEHADTSWLTTNLRMRSRFIWGRITRDNISFRRFIVSWVLALSELIVFSMQGLWSYKKGSRLVTNSIKYKVNLWLQGKLTGFCRSREASLHTLSDTRRQVRRSRWCYKLGGRFLVPLLTLTNIVIVICCLFPYRGLWYFWWT